MSEESFLFVSAEPSVIPCIVRLFRLLAAVLDSPVSWLPMLDLLFELAKVLGVVRRSREKVVGAAFRVPSLLRLWGWDVIV